MHHPTIPLLIMVVKVKKRIHGGLLSPGVEYEAEPMFFDGRQKVKVHVPASVVCVIVGWDDIEVVG